jgi:hypothetical protein
VALREVASDHFFSPEVESHLIGERHGGSAQQLLINHVGAQVSLADEHREGTHCFVPTGGVAVGVRADHIFDGLVGQGFHLVHDVVVVALEFGVDQNDILIRQVDGDVSSVAGDHIQVVLDLFELIGTAGCWARAIHIPAQIRVLLALVTKHSFA